MTEIVTQREVVACIWKFVGLGLTMLSDVERSADALGLEVGGEVLTSIVALASR